MNQPTLSYSHLSKEDSIEELHLTNRSFNALNRAGIRTVGEVSQLVDSDKLKTISGLGRKSIREIEAKLAQVKCLDGAGVEPKIDSVSDQDYPYLSPEEPIKRLNLSRRSSNALRRVHIRTVGGVLQLAESGRLRTIRGLGMKGILEIKENLSVVKILKASDVGTDTHVTPERNNASFSQEDPIEKLDLSERSYNALTRAGVQTVGEVLQLVDTGKLITIPALGKKSISEIKGELAQVKFSEGLGIEAHTDTTLNQNYILLSRRDSIEALDLTAHSFSALVRADIRTVEDILQFVEFGNLQTVRELGIQCILEIANILPLIRFQDNPEAASWTPSDVWRWLVAKILRDSEVESMSRRDEIPKRVVEWQLQLLSKQFSRGLLHEEAEIAGKSIREWGTVTETTERNQAYQMLSTILSGSINVCEEIEDFLSYLPGQNSMTILLLRYGPKPKTLRQTGVELGISRERVRQLENEIKNKIISISGLKRRPALLRMQSALIIARDIGLDITYENWTQHIRLSGLVGNWTIQDYSGMDPVEVMIAVRNLLHECNLSWLQTTENLQYALELAASGSANISARIPHTRKTLPNEIRRLISGHTKNSGGVYSKWLSDESGKELEEIKTILQVLGYNPICEGWYILDSCQVSYHDVFHHGLRKMFQYCGPLNIDDVCAGMRQVLSRKHTVLSKRREFPVPPPVVMDEIIRIDGYKCEDELYYWDGGSDEELNAGETVIMNCFDRVGQVLHHSELVDAFIESDRSYPLLHATLRRSPLFETLEYGLYKLRGSDVTYEDIERAKAAGKQQSLDLEEEYDTSGNIMLSVSLSSVAIGSCTIYCEQFRDLSGNWPCHVNGQDAGELIATENEFRHLRKSFELLECRPGDRLKFTFNMWKRMVVIELAGTNAQL